MRWEKAGGASRVRVRPELVDARRARRPAPAGAQPFDASLTDVFQVQADIAGKVADALGVALADSTRRELAAKPTENLAAYDEFLKGEAASQAMNAQDPGGLRRAIGYYERAVALDSTFAPAWAQLSAPARARTPTACPTPRSASRRGSRRSAPACSGPTTRWSTWPSATTTASVNPIDNDARWRSTSGASGSRPTTWTCSVRSRSPSRRWAGGTARRRGSPARRCWIRARSPIAARWPRRYCTFGGTPPPTPRRTGRSRSRRPISDAWSLKVMVALGRGDLDGARAVIRAAAADRSCNAVRLLASYQDLYWVLDDEQQRLVLACRRARSTTTAAIWGIVRAQLVSPPRRPAPGRRLRRLGAARVRGAGPGRAGRRAAPRASSGWPWRISGGRRRRCGKASEAWSCMPISRDAYIGPYIQLQLARIYMLVGEPEKALDQLEPLLKVPYYLSPGWLRIDPTFDPLRSNPRFRRLVEGTA